MKLSKEQELVLIKAFLDDTPPCVSTDGKGIVLFLPEMISLNEQSEKTVSYEDMIIQENFYFSKSQIEEEIEILEATVIGLWDVGVKTAKHIMHLRKLISVDKYPCFSNKLTEKADERNIQE